MLFEILPLIVYQTMEPGLTELPVEMLAAILRYLDLDSLLNVVKAYKKCMEVCLGDPVLRRRLKMLVKEKKKQKMERLINPALGVTVTRNGATKMFNLNVIKNVKIKATPKPEDLPDIVMNLIKSKKKDIVNTKVKSVSYRL